MKGGLAFALLLGACDATQPCDGKSPVCIAIKVTGELTLDVIEVTATLPAGTRLRGRTIESREEFALPVQFALRLPGEAIGLVGLELVGLRNGSVLAAGAGQVTVPDSGKARVTVGLGDFNADFGVRDLSVVPTPDFAVASDIAEPDPTLSPGSLDFGAVLVGATRTAQLIFRNPRARDVVVSDIQLVPAGPPFSFASTGTCKPNESVGPMQSCTVDLSFAPGMRQTVFAQVKVGFGAAGEVGATVGGRGVAWQPESLETPDGSIASNLFTVWGPALDDVWVGGDAAGLYRRRNSSWTKLTPPGAVNIVSNIWGTSSTDVYLVSSDAKAVFHLGTNPSWGSDPITSIGQMNAVFGLSSSDVFVASNTGEIFRGVAGNWAPDPRTTAGSPLFALWGTSPEDLYATGTEVAHRTMSGWGNLTLTGTSGGYFSVWGSGPNDVYVVGWDLAPSGYGFIKHSNGMQFSTETLAQSVPGLRGVWGAAADEVYAVGKKGTILRRGASGWTLEATGVADLYAVWGADGEVFAVGDAGTILHRH